MKILMNNRAGEAYDFIFLLDCCTDVSNRTEVSSCCFFDFLLAMAADEGVDGLGELCVFSEMDSAKKLLLWIC